ncbi:MAG: hypothetical protein HC910_04565 [Spirulinaceae cyanobacterium SM2_1_0]|nr:hypothetical protein [Spirulinaceae cyanobacterium SM2_1_0]
MKPKFEDTASWQQAEQLMQPSLIRLIDNLRQRLETSTWRSCYTEVSEPLPGHRLELTRGSETHAIHLWELCFRICFLNYPPLHPGVPVAIDSRLLGDRGEVEWEILDDKVQQIVAAFFDSLETAPAP